MVERLIPQADFSAIGNLPATVEAGRGVARQYALRAAMSNIAPDDFQGMAKVLQQFGTPEQAITAYAAGRQTKALEEQIAHERVMEGFAGQTAARETATAASETASRGQRDALAFLNAQQPFTTLSSALGPNASTYTEARDQIINGWGPSPFKAATQTVQDVAAAAAVAHGAKNETQIQAYIKAHTPGPADLTSAARKAKLDNLDRDLPGFAQTAKTLGVGGWGNPIPGTNENDYSITPYKEPVKSPATTAGSRAAALPPGPYSPAPTAAIPPPVTVSPPDSETANAATGIQPRTVRTVPIIPPLQPYTGPKIKKGSPEETQALGEANAKIAAHANDPPEVQQQIRTQVLQRLQDMGIGQ